MSNVLSIEIGDRVKCLKGIFYFESEVTNIFKAGEDILYELNNGIVYFVDDLELMTSKNIQ